MGDLFRRFWSVNQQSDKAMDNSKEWYYLDGNNQVTGPLTGDALRQLTSVGAITDQTLVAEAGTEEWGRRIFFR